MLNLKLISKLSTLTIFQLETTPFSMYTIQLSQFLINEQIQLKNHLYERAQNILRQAEAIENSNQSRIINDVLKETLTAVDKAYSENK